MMSVAKFSIVLAASVIVTAMCIAVLSGFTFETMASPHFWVISVSLAGMSGLAMGNGIGERKRARARKMPARGLLPA
jgi:hypothetical protein